MSRTIKLSLFLLASLLTACGANEGILKSGKETPSSNSQPSKTEFEQDLDAMQTADFKFVYVLRRKDRGAIDAEDRSAIKVNTVDANRRVGSDDGKAFIIGTNTAIAPANMTALYGRFAVEDRSPAPQPENSNANANANK